MKVPQVKNAENYKGLYIVDFGDSVSVGFTADEAAELLESEKFADVKVYRIHNAYPDGRMELKGVPREKFELESGMFFYACDEESARRDFKRLSDIAVSDCPPCRAKLQLAKTGQPDFVTALIYPAEFDEDFSAWLLENDYRTEGPVEGGVSGVSGFYKSDAEILDTRQLFAADSFQSRTGAELLANAKVAVQR